MTEFSNYLENFMKEKDISMATLARETNVDRAAMYRYVKGTRIPSEIGIVKKIADVLQMSVRERGKLLEEYDKLILGEEMVYSYQYIQNFLSRLVQVPEKEEMMRERWKLVWKQDKTGSVIRLGSKQEIANYIFHVFEYIIQKNRTEEEVYMVMQPIYPELQQFLLNVFANSSIKVEQIICLEQSLRYSYKNLKIFQEILPLYFHISGYEVYSYYDSAESHVNNMCFMPNIIILFNQVIQFDYEMQCGVVVCEENYAGIMKKRYEDLRKETVCMVKKGGTLSTYTENLVGYKKCLTVKMLMQQPCMAKCIGRKFLEEHIYPMDGKKQYVDALVDAHGDWEGKIYQDGKIDASIAVCYGNVNGVEQFIRDGRIREFPSGLYSAFSLEERKIIMQRMIVLIKDKKIYWRVIREKVYIPEEVSILFTETETGKEIIFTYVFEKDIRQVSITEQSFYRTWMLYYEYLEKKGWVYSEEESLNYLERVLEQL